MTINSNAGRKTVGLTIAFGLTFAMMTALHAQDTIVEGKAKTSNYAEERVGFADLDLRDSDHQLMLVSRVKKAARNVCDIVYEGWSVQEKFNSRCPRRSFKEAKPQIDVAIANALNGRKVAMNFVIAAGR